MDATEKNRFFSDLNKQIAAEFISSSLDLGVYPRSVEGGGNPYKERTEYMNGWNAAVMQIGSAIEKSLDTFRNADEDLALLVLAGLGFFSKDKFVLNVNDTFFYACADCEEVSPEEYRTVASFFKRYGFDGICYWVSIKRNIKSQIPEVQEEIDRIAAAEEKRNKKHRD